MAVPGMNTQEVNTSSHASSYIVNNNHNHHDRNELPTPSRRLLVEIGESIFGRSPAALEEGESLGGQQTGKAALKGIMKQQSIDRSEHPGKRASNIRIEVDQEKTIHELHNDISDSQPSSPQQKYSNYQQYKISVTSYDVATVKRAKNENVNFSIEKKKAFIKRKRKSESSPRKKGFEE